MLGQRGTGAAYAGATGAFLGWGLYCETRRGSGEVNAPLLYAQQVYVASLYASYRDMRLSAAGSGGERGSLPWVAGAAGRMPPQDASSMGELAAAPLRSEQWASPWVWGSALAGAGLNLALARTDSTPREFRDVRRVRYLGDSFNRDLGAAAHGAYWVPASLGAGVAEEALFRGILQSDFEGRWGRGTGLAAASALFGLAHVTRPQDLESWGHAGFAGLAGLYLGWRYQRTGYRLAQPIAAHFWFDVAAGVALFAASPEDNALGAQIDFAF